MIYLKKISAFIICLSLIVCSIGASFDTFALSDNIAYGGAVFSSESDGTYTFGTVGQGGAVVYGWQLDITRGLELNIENWDAGWIMISFASAKNALKGTYASEGEPTILLGNANGKLQTQYWNGSAALATEVIQSDALGKHLIKFNAFGNYYYFNVDGIDVCRAASFGKAGLDAVNNYDTAAGIAKGAYLQIFTESSGVSITGLKENYYPFTANNYAEYSKESDNTYSFENCGGSGAIISNWRTDVTAGIELNINNFGLGWIMVSFAQNVSDLNGSFPSVSTPTLLLANIEGKLQTQYWNGSAALATTLTDFPAIGNHTVSIMRGVDGYYRFAIDGNEVCYAASFDKASINSINNYNEQTGKSGGAYFQIFAEKHGAKITGIKSADTALEIPLNIADSQNENVKMSVSSVNYGKNGKADDFKINADGQDVLFRSDVQSNGCNQSIFNNKKYILKYSYRIKNSACANKKSGFGFGIKNDCFDVNVTDAPEGKWMQIVKEFNSSEISDNYIVFSLFAASGDSYNVQIADIELTELRKGFSAFAINYSDGSFEIKCGVAGEKADITAFSMLNPQASLWFYDCEYKNRINSTSLENMSFPQDGKLVNLYEYFAVRGDSDGDCLISVNDLIFLRKVLLSVENETDKISLDMNNDKLIGLIDLVKLKKKIICEENSLGFETENGWAFLAEAFGAVGNGVCDDGVAINNAIQRASEYTAQNPDKIAQVRFGEDKTYLLSEQNEAGKDSGYNIALDGVSNIKLVGNNTTVIGSADKGYMSVQGSSNVSVEGLNFTLKRDVACRARVISRSKKVVTFSVPSWYISCVEKYNLPDSAFAIPDNGGRGQSCIDKIEKTSDSTVKITFKDYAGYANSYNVMNKDTYVFLPTPGYAHNGVGFRIAYNGNVEFKNINVWNNKEFGFNMIGNSSEIKFENIYLGPENDNSCEVVSWRDVVHAKDNRGNLTFNNCIFKGAEDDIFNISNTMLRVDKVEKTSNGTILTLYGLDYNGAYFTIYNGDTVTGLNVSSGAYYGKTKVLQTLSAGRILVDKNFNIDEGAYIYFDEYANPNTTITGGEYTGSFRIRSSGTVITDTIFNVLFMFTSYEGHEGPIPSDIIYKNCRFNPINDNFTGKTLMTFNCTPAVNNIVFDNCNFAYDNIIDRSKAGNGVIIK